MKAAKKHTLRRGDELATQYEAVEVEPMPHLRCYAPEPTWSDRQAGAVMVWALLAKLGMSSRQIETMCSNAARDHATISRRLGRFGIAHATEARDAG